MAQDKSAAKPSADDKATREVNPDARPLNTRQAARLGELTGISAKELTGQTVAALDLCAGVRVGMKSHHLQSGVGDTLQAVRTHAFEHPLTSPGEADLTAQFDFAAFAASQSGSCTVDGPTTQAEFLGRLGIVERASMLMAANPARAGEIEAGVARLMTPDGMGTRFKVVGIRSPEVPKLPGF